MHRRDNRARPAAYTTTPDQCIWAWGRRVISELAPVRYMHLQWVDLLAETSRPWMKVACNMASSPLATTKIGLLQPPRLSSTPPSVTVNHDLRVPTLHGRAQLSSCPRGKGASTFQLLFIRLPRSTEPSKPPRLSVPPFHSPAWDGSAKDVRSPLRLQTGSSLPVGGVLQPDQAGPLER